MRPRCGIVSALCLLAACAVNEPASHPHYVLGQPYQSEGVWWYPRDSYDFDETGLAAVYSDDHPHLTTDGEVFSQSAFAAAQPTLQLPSVVRLTELQTGRSVLVRINDRGTPTPDRLVQVTRQVADSLGMPRDGAAQVRVTVLPVPTEAADEQVGGMPMPHVERAPRREVLSATLAPPPGARQEIGRAVLASNITTSSPADRVAERLPETVTQGTPHPGRLWVRLDTFQSYEYAAIQRAKLVGLPLRIEPAASSGGGEGFRVMAGPFDSVAQADAALYQAIRGGVPDARIVVE
jgi:rare lipoprotein A